MKFYLDAATPSEPSLTRGQEAGASQTSFSALGERMSSFSGPLEQETGITGPMAAKIFASSSTDDLDLFLTFRVFAEYGREIHFQGTVDPHTPLSQEWLGASHRQLDSTKTLGYRPYHAHRGRQTLQPGKIYELDV